MSFTNSNLSGTSGSDVANMTIKVDEDLEPGEYELKVTKVKLGAKKAENNKAPADFTVKIIVGDTTGIDGVEAEGASSDEAIYDLTGRKVTNMVKGGIYIKGGKKFFNK